MYDLKKKIYWNTFSYKKVGNNDDFHFNVKHPHNNEFTLSTERKLIIINFQCVIFHFFNNNIIIFNNSNSINMAITIKNSIFNDIQLITFKFVCEVLS